MTNLCWNKLEIIGDNADQLIDHFSQMGYDAPPYYSILVDSDAVYFDSKWTPPLNDLKEIAESFDVDLKLVYHLPNESNREKFNYTCLKNLKLEGTAKHLKEMALNAFSIQELEKVSEAIDHEGTRQAISTNEWIILRCLTEKRYNEIASETRQPDEDLSTPKRRMGR